ncbi:MAG: hypothetical protein L0206_05775, partial [Actinobacteria bacterium]|nr:hypothetical protein [Actinomycetota bacterium]
DTDGICAGVDCGGHGTCVEKEVDVAGCECEAGYIEAAGPTCVLEPRELCDSGKDEDEDGFVDCADFDCLGDTLCCGGTAVPDPVIDQSFDGSFASEWLLFEPDRGTPADTGDALREMGDYPEGNGMRWELPVDFSGGLEIAIGGSSNTSDDSGDCTTIADCSDYIGVALTRVITFVEGVPFPTSFAVYVVANGQVLVTRGGVVRARGTSPRNFNLRVRLTPAVSQNGSGFAAEVVSIDGDEETSLYVTDTPLLLPEDNLRVDGSTGATFAILGRTAHPEPGIVIVDSVTATPLLCANPAAWTQSDDIGDATTLGAGTWAEGSFGSPTALLVAGTGCDPDYIRLLYDGSNLDPFFEIYGDVNRSVGEATFTLGPDTFSPGGIVIGEDPPNCIGGSCPDPPDQHYDARRPGMYRSAVDVRSLVVEAGGEEIWSYGYDGSWSTGSQPILVAQIEDCDAFPSAAAIVREGD